MKRRARAEGRIPQAVGRTAHRVVARVSGEHGMTLVELLVAITVLAFGLLALASVSTSALLSLRDSTSRQGATEAAAEVLELARDIDWAGLANRSGDPMVPAGTFDPDGPSCLAAENVLKSVTGPVTGAPFQVGTATPTPGALTVRTYVTDVAALDCPAAPATPTPPPAPARRVTAVVQWLSGGAVHETRKSTIIALSGRGDDEVLFEVAPPTQAVTDVPGVLCLEHLLTNQGVQDAYQIDAPALPSGVLSFGAYTDDDHDGEPDPSEVIGLATRVVPVGGTLPLLFCYEVDEVNVSHAFTVGVRSVEESLKVVDVDHTVQTLDTLTLYLHNPSSGTLPYRDVSSLNTSVLPMDRVVPAAVVPPGAPPASAGTMHDYDAGVTVPVGGVPVPLDALGYQGMLLPRVPDAPLPNPLPVTGDLNDPDSAYHGRWRYQFPRTLRLAGGRDVTIKVWTAPTAALGNPLDGLGLPLPPPSVPFGLRYRLVHLDQSGAVLNEIVLSPEEEIAGVPGFAPVYLHNTWGWQESTWTAPVPSTITVAKHEYLRLELVCDLLLNTQSCHVGHDTPDRAASVEVPLT